jgi:hypothetical protein
VFALKTLGKKKLLQKIQKKKKKKKKKINLEVNKQKPLAKNNILHSLTFSSCSYSDLGSAYGTLTLPNDTDPRKTKHKYHLLISL